MLKKIITTVLVVSTVATSSLAMASPWHDRGGDRHGYNYRGDYRDHRDYRGWDHRHGGWDHRRDRWSHGERFSPRYHHVNWNEHRAPYSHR